ncbi:hypothetical protein BDK51DRAFT_8641, partial [Blyttiomyces helicus]
QAVFHYCPKTKSNNPFELGIASPPMLAEAWQYGDGKLLMDGTFGICLYKILLIVMLVIDESYTGVPVALFLFSAPLGNRQTSSGHDAAILRQFLSEWKCALGQKEGMPFTPKICMTETNVKEINALKFVWAVIIALLSMFHIFQSLKNRLIKELGRGGPPH